MNQVLPGQEGQVRVVFHHLPLPSHPWARTAAIGAACAQMEGDQAFWAIHDQIFQHQADITPANISDKLVDFAQASGKVDAQSFRTCLKDQSSLGLVFQDINLAAANNIQATPTLFINGRRVPGIRNKQELLDLIAMAKATPGNLAGPADRK